MDQAVNISEEMKSPAIQPDASVAPAAENLAPEAKTNILEQKSKDKDFVSTGQKIHNEVTYRGVDWLLNSTLAVAFAYATKQTERGQRFWTRPIEGFFSRIMKPLFKSAENLKSGSEWGAAFISIMFGGTAIIPVMMGLENKQNKKSIIRWLDEKIYGKEAVANDPKFEEAYSRIDEEPKKKFSTGMIARIASLAPLIALTVSPINNYIKKGYYDYIGAGSKKLAEAVGIKPKSMMEAATNGVGTKWDYLHQTIGFDVGLTFIYSFMHEAAYKALAALGLKKHDEGKSNIKSTPTDPVNSAIDSVANIADIAYDVGTAVQNVSQTNHAAKVSKAQKFSPTSLTERAVRSEQEAAMGA